MDSPGPKKKRIFDKEQSDGLKSFRKKWIQYQPVRFDKGSPKKLATHDVNMYRLSCVNYGNDSQRYRETVEKQSKRIRQFVEKIKIQGNIENLKRSLRTKTEQTEQDSNMLKTSSASILLSKQNRQAFKCIVKEVIQQIEQENNLQGPEKPQHISRSVSPKEKQKAVVYEQRKSLHLLKDIKKQLHQMFTILHIK